MEELTTTKAPELTNKELKDYTRKIKKCGDNIRTNFMKIAHNLDEIDKTECYLDDGFEDVQDYANKVLGIQKTTCYNFLKIAKEFLNDEGTRTLLTSEGNDYGVSQLQALLPIGIDKAKELHNNEVINPTMSVRQIKTIIKEQTTTPEPEDENTIDTTGEELSDEVVKTIGIIEIMEDGEILYRGDIEDLRELVDDIITNYLQNR